MVKLDSPQYSPNHEYYIVTRACYILGFLSGMILFMPWFIVPLVLIADYLYQHPEQMNEIYVYVHYNLSKYLISFKKRLVQKQKLKKNS